MLTPVAYYEKKRFLTMLRIIQSTLPRTDTGADPEGHLWIYRHYVSFLDPNIRLIETQIKGVKKGRDQLQASVLQRCPLRQSRLHSIYSLQFDSLLFTIFFHL